ncbi:hypothetical protein E1180_14635 [Roseibium denhamense]|nr:hypothetical protein [Roseibium denhamense]MTI06751.1 hypothetical protein [Roseibium denhamense]
MFVALGFCTAGLICLAILPAFYRRAARLTEEALKATTPSSYSEVRAAQDQIRARHAIELRRVERLLEKEREKAARFQTDATRLQTDMDALQKEAKQQYADFKQQLADKKSDAKAVDLLSDEVKTLQQKLADAEKALADNWAKSSAEDDQGKSEQEEIETAEAGWLPATDTMSLATITALEAEVSTLKSKLSKYEPLAAAEFENDRDKQARTQLADLEAQIVDIEAKYVAAQAEVTRLSIMLEASPASDQENETDLAKKVKSLADHNAHYQAEIDRQKRELTRRIEQQKRLQADLENASGLKELRQEFQGLVTLIQSGSKASTATKKVPDTKKGAKAPAKRPRKAAVEDNTDGVVPSEETDAHPTKEGLPSGKQDAKPATAKSSDIASAAEALVSRIVASSRSKEDKSSSDDGDTAQAPKRRTGKSTPRRKTKASSQSKKDVA